MSSLATENSEMDLWALVTIASIGKQIGRLQERFQHDEVKLDQVSKVELNFESLLFGAGTEAYSLLTLAQELDTIKNQ